MVTRRAVLIGGAAMACSATNPFTASAQTHRVTQMIVPFPAGSLTDIVARQIADLMGPAMDTRIVVDNRGGAEGAIGMKTAAMAPADGSTLAVVGVSTAVSNIFLFKDSGYDHRTDFAPVGMIAESPYLLVAAPDLPVSTTRELMELARQKPGEISYSYGSGSARVAGQMLATQAGVDVLGVPYRGGLEALTDVVAGRISYTMTDFANGLPQIREGKVKGLGVTVAKPFELSPDLPPIEEAGYGPYDISVWFGLSAPAGTPPEAVRRASEALGKALADPSLMTRFASQGLLIRTGDADAFAGFVDAEIEKWGRLCRETGLAVQ